MASIPSHVGPTSTSSIASMMHAQSPSGPLSGQAEESTTSHGSHSRFAAGSTSTVAGGGGPGSSSSNATSVQSRMQYQPLSMADALARYNHDHSRALDELLAERNKFCLEASKLATENMRLWNLMKRIRRENEDLKVSNTGGHSTNGNGLRSSPLSNVASASASELVQQRSSPIASAPSTSAVPSVSSPSAVASPPPTAPILSSSYTAPTLVYPSDGTGSGFGSSSNSTDTSAKTALRASRIAPSLYESASGHLDEDSRDSTMALGPSALLSSSSALASRTTSLDVHPPSSSSLSTELPIASSSTPDGAANELASLNLDDETALERDVDSADALHSQQQTSIMQQRAAAQAQRLAQLQSGNVDRPGSVGSHEFEAVDGSSIAPSEGRSSARTSAEIVSKRGSGHPMRSGAAPSSPHIASPLASPAPDRGSSSRPYSSDSSRNAFLPRLDASLLQFVSLSISGSNLRSIERGREIVSFFISVDVDAPPGRVLRHGSWRVEKTYADILALDARIKQKHGKTVAKRMSTIQLPNQTLFKDHAPSKVDRRKALLEAYLCALLTIPMPDKDDLCTFLCTDAMLPKMYDPDALTKEGFLTKKGQNLGRWVTRWYVLSDSSLDHFESRGGIHLGSINIVGAQIGRQQKSVTADSDENSYRHAFLILETKPPTASNEQRQIIRHVLCAESDEERDDWVDVLVRAIGEADNRDQDLDEEAAKGLSTFAYANTMASSTPSRTANGSAVRLHERTGSEGDSTIIHGPSPMTRSASGSTPVSDITHAQQSEPQQVSVPAAMVNQSGNLPRSISEAGAMNFGQIRQGSVGPSTSGAPLTHMAAVQHPHAHVHPHQHAHPHPHQHPHPHAHQYHHQNQFQLQNQQLASPMSRYGPLASPSRPPKRSTSQDIGSSSSTGHGMSNDSAALRPPSPDPTSPGQSIPGASRPSRDRPRPAISGPMNGTPIPTGYKFGGGKDESSNASKEASETKKRFWHRFGGSGGGDKSAQSRKVFGVPLTESLAVSNVSEGLELPSVVYRCIEYLEHRNAASEEGIYRLSGSSAVIKSLKDRFNAQGDVNLLASSEPFYDPHAIAGLLKQYLRELPSSVLTREMHLDFMRVNDITDRRERVNELGSLVSMLPLPNYSLLRTLCSHLIKVIERSDVNKMTMRNVGIVFSPTLGIPAGVFALFLTEFDWVFFTDAKGEPAPRTMEEDIIPPDETELGLGVSSHHVDDGTASATAGPRRGGHVSAHRNNRNSLSYNEAEADKLLGGPQARNRLSTYNEDFDNAESEPLYEQKVNTFDVEDGMLRDDNHTTEGHQTTFSGGSLDAPWSPTSTGFTTTSNTVRSPPDVEITSAYAAANRTPMSPTSPLRGTRPMQPSPGMGTPHH